MPEPESNSPDGPLAEFTALRAEILQSLQIQWNSFALQLTATGAIFSFALSSSSRTGLLLILPVVTYALSNYWVNNLTTLERIGRYIRDDLSGRVPGELKWERWLKEDHAGKHRQDLSGDKDKPSRLHSFLGKLVRWARKKNLPYLPFPYIFPATSLAALAWTIPYIFSSNHVSDVTRSFLVIVWVFDFVITALSFRHLRRRPEPDPDETGTTQAA